MPRDVIIEVDNEVVTYLKQAKARISDPKKWTRRALFRNHKGEPISGYQYVSGETNKDKIHSMCMMGTLQWSFGRVEMDAVALVQCMLGGLSIPKFNDSYSTTHTDVLAAFDRAIEFAARR